MIVVVLLGAYLLGSIPFSAVVAQIWGKVDLRRTGSGNPGGMNTLREVGLVPGLLAVLLDVAKGTAPVLLAKWLSLDPWAPPLAGAAAVTGHCYSFYLILAYFAETGPRREPRLPWWKAQPRLGGKGLATGIGALLAISLPALLTVVGLFGLMALLFLWRGVRGSPVVARSTTVSLLAAPALLWLWEHSLWEHSWPQVVAGIIMAVIATIKHIPYLALGPNWPNAHLSLASSEEPANPDREAAST